MFSLKVTDADKEIYQTKVNEAMTKYKSEYNDWFESLSVDEQRVEKERTSLKSNKKSVATIDETPLSTCQPYFGLLGDCVDYDNVYIASRIWEKSMWKRDRKYVKSCRN